MILTSQLQDIFQGLHDRLWWKISGIKVFNRLSLNSHSASVVEISTVKNCCTCSCWNLEVTETFEANLCLCSFSPTWFQLCHITIQNKHKDHLVLRDMGNFVSVSEGYGTLSTVVFVTMKEKTNPTQVLMRLIHVHVGFPYSFSSPINFSQYIYSLLHVL